MGLYDYIFISCFLVAIISVGSLFAKNSKNTDAFMLGDKKMPWWATGISCIMAIMSTVAVVGTPGEAYNHGLRYYIIELFVPFAGLLFFSLFIRFYFAAKAFTPFTYLEKRFDTNVRTVISTAFFMIRLSYFAMVLVACSVVFKGIADWNRSLTILSVGIIAIAYCAMGGIKAIIWVNMFKFVALAAGITVTISVCLTHVDGGVFGVIRYAFENGRGFNLTAGNADFFSFDPHVRITFWLLLINAIAQYMFLTSADQITIQQLLSTNSYQKARMSFMSSIFIMIPMVSLLWFLGLCLFAYFGQYPVDGGNPPGDVALFKFIRSRLPSPLPGLVVSALLATAISTSGSAMAALSTVATKDFYVRFIKPDADEQTQVRVSRVLVFVIGSLAIMLSITMSIVSGNLGETVFELIGMWMAMGTIIAPTFFIGVLFPKCNGRHALFAILLGWTATLAMVMWYIVSKWKGNPISFLVIQVPGFFIVIFAGLLAQIFAKSNNSQKIEKLTMWTLHS